MKDNKIAVIIAWRDLWHPNCGGAEIYITKVAEKLRDCGYKVIFFTECYKGAKREEEINGIEYIRRGNAVTLHAYFPIYFKKHLKNSCNVLIENFNAVPFRIPRIHSNTLTVIHHIQSPEWETLLGKFLGRLVARYFTESLTKTYKDKGKIVTVSPSSKKDLVSLDFEEKNINIIYNGIEVPIARSIEKPSDQINILSLGRVRPTKHIDEAIEMIKYSLTKNIKNIHLDIVGTGDDEKRLQSLVKEYGLEQFVTFWGFVNEKKKIELLQKAHLHVQFSRKEGWGITVIEASASATPTICYRVPGLVDSVKDNTGYFIDGSLKNTWEKAINDIRENNHNYQSKQEKGMEWARNFKWEAQMENFMRYLESSE